MQIVELGSDFTDDVALLALLQAAFSGMDGRINPPSSLHRLNLAGLREKRLAERVFATVDLRGCLFLRPGTAYWYLGKFAVAPDQQGAGIGRALLNAAVGLVRNEGSCAIELETRVELVENHAAFAKMGFVKIGESAHAGYDRPTSIRMRLDL